MRSRSAPMTNECHVASVRVLFLLDITRPNKIKQDVVVIHGAASTHSAPSAIASVGRRRREEQQHREQKMSPSRIRSRRIRCRGRCRCISLQGRQRQRQGVEERTHVFSDTEVEGVQHGGRNKHKKARARGPFLTFSRPPVLTSCDRLSAAAAAATLAASTDARQTSGQAGGMRHAACGQPVSPTDRGR